MRKERFPLEMDNGVQVRSLEELKENWNLERVITYYKNGKLLEWANDRYYCDIAEILESLQSITEDGVLKKRICNIFDVKFEANHNDIESFENENKRRYSELSKYTSDEDILNNMRIVAFNQDELEELINIGEKIICLFNNTFNISILNTDIKYIGIGEAKVIINSEQVLDFESMNIEFVNIVFDDKYKEKLKVEKEKYQELAQIIVKKWNDINDIKIQGCDKYNFDNYVQYSENGKVFIPRVFNDRQSSETAEYNFIYNMIHEYYEAWASSYFSTNGYMYKLQIDKAIKYYAEYLYDNIANKLDDILNEIYAMVKSESLVVIKNAKLRNEILDIAQNKEARIALNKLKDYESIKKCVCDALAEGRIEFCKYSINYYQNKITIGEAYHASSRSYVYTERVATRELVDRCDQIIDKMSSDLYDRLVKYITSIFDEFNKYEINRDLIVEKINQY